MDLELFVVLSQFFSICDMIEQNSVEKGATKMLEFTITSEAAMIALGKEIGSQLSAGNHIVLTGDLGAGKTTFTKGLAQGLSIEQMIKSPTYTIIREYPNGRLPFYHMDIYRLSDGVDELGLDEYYEQDGICVIEWGKLFPEELPDNYLDIVIETQADDARKLCISFHGDRERSGYARLEQKVTGYE